MYVKKFEDVLSEILYETAEYKWLLPRETTKTRSLQIAKGVIKKDSKTYENVHKDHEQAYIILEGEGVVKIGNEERIVSEGTIVYIPINVKHFLRCSERSEKVVYIFVNNWPYEL